MYAISKDSGKRDDYLTETVASAIVTKWCSNFPEIEVFFGLEHIMIDSAHNNHNKVFQTEWFKQSNLFFQSLEVGSPRRWHQQGWLLLRVKRKTSSRPLSLTCRRPSIPYAFTQPPPRVSMLKLLLHTMTAVKLD